MKLELFPEIETRTHVMGILNLTTDSFSGDGLAAKQNFFEQTLAQARRFVAEGADVLDLGAESTRPGYTPISTDQEIERLVPVIRSLRNELPDTLISVDCYRSQTAEACLAEGAQIVNDIWGFKFDEKMADVSAKYGATVILMHNARKGEIARTEKLGGFVEEAHYDNFLEDIKHDLQESITLAKQAGIPDEKIMIDPGIGFGKTRQQNFVLLRHLDVLLELGYPILLGVSRKGFIGYTLDLPVDQRLEGSLAANAYGILHGAGFVRVHDVKETVRLARILDAIRFAHL